MRRHILISVSAFLVFGLLGPLIQRLFSAPASFLILIWPALFLGSGGTAQSLRRDLVIATGVNVIFFGVVGFVVAAIATPTRTLAGGYLAIATVVMLAEAWGAGFSFAYFSWRDLTSALLLYSLPFFVIWRSQLRTSTRND